MKFEGDVNYAADPYGYRPPPAPRRGLFTLGFAVVGIAAFAGAVVVTYGGGSGVVGEGGIPLLTADTTPTKMRPEQPGGMQVPHQDKLVYERLSDGGTRPGVERLLPPPEEPLPRPVVSPQVPAPPPLPQAPVLAQVAPPPGATATVPRELPPEPAAVPAAPAPEPVPPAPSLPAAAPAAVPAPAPAVQETPRVAPKPAPPPAVAALSAPVPAPAPAPLKPPAAAAPAVTPAAVKPPAAGGAGGWRVQLASVRSESEASAEWKRLSSRYPDALGGLGVSIVKADLGEKGIYYRVQGSGVDETKARSICAQLKAQNVGCVIVRP